MPRSRAAAGASSEDVPPASADDLLVQLVEEIAGAASGQRGSVREDHAVDTIEERLRELREGPADLQPGPEPTPDVEPAPVPAVEPPPLRAPSAVVAERVQVPAASRGRKTAAPPPRAASAGTQRHAPVDGVDAVILRAARDAGLEPVYLVGGPVQPRRMAKTRRGRIDAVSLNILLFATVLALAILIPWGGARLADRPKEQSAAADCAASPSAGDCLPEVTPHQDAAAVRTTPAAVAEEDTLPAIFANRRKVKTYEVDAYGRISPRPTTSYANDVTQMR